MPPKASSGSSKKKANTDLWLYCTQCKVYITHKSKLDHEEHCPVAEYVEGGNNQRLDYIRRGVLYSTMAEKRAHDIEAMETLSTKHQNNVIFVSEEALRLLKWRIGQYVLIEGSGHPGAPLVRSIWPIPAKFLTTVLINEFDYDIYWTNFQRGSNLLRIRAIAYSQMQIVKHVRLRFIPENPFKHRYLQSNETLNAQLLKDINRVVKHELKDLYVTQGTNLHMNFFNQFIRFEVEEWQVDKKSRAELLSLHEQIANLSLEDAKHLVHVEGSVKDTTLIGQITSDSTITLVEKTPPSKDDAEACKTTATLNDIGGLSQQLEEIQEALDLALDIGKHYMPKGLKTSRGLLIYGPPGCGKTMICEALSNFFTTKMRNLNREPKILRLHSGDVFSRFLGETEKNLLDFSAQVFRHYPEPTLIIIEELHILCPKADNNLSEIARRASSAILRILDSLNNEKEGERCFILATTGKLDFLNMALRRCGRFDNEIEIPVPNRTARFEILQCIFNKMKCDSDYTLSEDEINQIAEITHGFVGADLLHLVRQAHIHASKRDNSKSINIRDLRTALAHVHPSAMREVLIECPNVRWKEIGGQAELKLKLQQAIEWPLKHSEHFLRMGVDPPRGILLYGPPGCSKTMIAKALATESSLNFISIKGPELFSMWVGESERAVREVFRKARHVAPAIVFFDEIDAIGGERSTDAHGMRGGGKSGGDSVQERVLTQLLTELDGVEKLENVTILAATNRPDLIDRALLRPGRIDRIIYVGLPDEDARKEIFRVKLERTPVSPDVDMDYLSVNTKGYSGAEIQAVCQEAALCALGDNLNCSHVTKTHFQQALKTIRPRTSSKLLQLYEEFADSALNS